MWPSPPPASHISHLGSHRSNGQSTASGQVRRQQAVSPLRTCQSPRLQSHPLLERQHRRSQVREGWKGKDPRHRRQDVRAQLLTKLPSCCWAVVSSCLFLSLTLNASEKFQTKVSDTCVIDMLLWLNSTGFLLTYGRVSSEVWPPCPLPRLLHGCGHESPAHRPDPRSLLE